MISLVRLGSLQEHGYSFLQMSITPSGLKKTFYQDEDFFVAHKKAKLNELHMMSTATKREIKEATCKIGSQSSSESVSILSAKSGSQNV